MIKRWDIYDIADELADLPHLVQQGVDDPRVLPEVVQDLTNLVNRLWEASKTGGWVMPSHMNYEVWDGVK